MVVGQLVVRKRLHLRYAYDERMDDGLSARSGIDAVARILSDPLAELGGLDDEGTALDATRPV